EGEHVDSFARLLTATRPGGGLGLLLARSGERLALLLVEERAVHGVAQVVVALIERADLDLFILVPGFARTRQACDQHREAADGRDDDERLHKKGGDVQPE